MIIITISIVAYTAVIVAVARATARGVRAALDDASVRWGELLGPAEPGQRTDLEPSLACEGSLDKDSRHRFRQLAAHREARP